MIAVVAAMGGEIEGDRQALLTGGEVAPVEGVGILGGGEAGILPDRPRLGDVHGRVGAAQIRRDAGIGIEAVEAGEVVGAVDALDREALRRQPRQAAAAAGRGGRIGEIDLREVRDTAHRSSALDTKHIVSGLQCRQQRRSPRKRTIARRLLSTPLPVRPAVRPDKCAGRPPLSVFAPRPPPRSHRPCRRSKTGKRCAPRP